MLTADCSQHNAMLNLLAIVYVNKQPGLEAQNEALFDVQSGRPTDTACS